MARHSSVFLLGAAALLAGLANAGSASAAPGDRGRIQGLSDVAFGILTSPTLDRRASQSVCAYSNSATGGYSVIASGSGPGGTFLLNSGVGQLAYEVEWAQAPGQTSGTPLVANGMLGGLSSTASNQNCSPAGTSASMIVVIRALAATAATASVYSGTLTLVIEPL